MQITPPPDPPSFLPSSPESQSSGKSAQGGCVIPADSRNLCLEPAARAHLRDVEAGNKAGAEETGDFLVTTQTPTHLGTWGAALAQPRIVVDLG